MKRTPTPLTNAVRAAGNQTLKGCIDAQASCRTVARRWWMLAILAIIGSVATVVVSIASAAADHREFRLRLTSVEQKQKALDEQIAEQLSEILKRLP